MDNEVISIDPAALGPAMLALTPMQRAFVYAKVYRGFNNKDAALAAGYSEKGVGVQGFITAHKPQVQAALAEESRKLMQGEGANSIRTLITIRDDPTAEKKDRIKCAIELLNRSGFHAVSESIQHVEHHLTESQKDARILQLAAELGLSKDEARKMLVAPDEKIIDATYQEIEPDEPPRELTPEEKEYRRRRDRDNEQDRARRKMTPEQLAEHKAAMRAEKSARFRLEYQQAQQQENGDVPDADHQPVAATPVAEDDPLWDIRDIL